jgi:phosphocarrier protein FPr
VPAGSLSKVATLGVLSGHDVEVRAGGDQARAALDHLLELAARNFDEPLDGPAGPAAPAGPCRLGAGRWGGIGAKPIPTAPGVGVGPAWSAQRAPIDLTGVRAGEPADEWRGLAEAIAAVRRSVAQVRARAVREVGEAEAAIFDAHLLLLDDADLLDAVRDRVDGGQSAAAAWSAATDAVAAEFAGVPDPYLQARAADIAAVRDAVLRELLGLGRDVAAPSGVVVAEDLTPAEAAELDPTRVVAVVLAHGAPHRPQRDPPAGPRDTDGRRRGADLLDVPGGTLLAVDGGSGEIVVDPSPPVQERFRARADDLARRAARLSRTPAHPPSPATACRPRRREPRLGGGRPPGRRVRRRPGRARPHRVPVPRPGAGTRRRRAGGGLPRDRRGAPGQADHVRTLDVGGDKPLSYLPMPAEANPFLGCGASGCRWPTPACSPSS